MSPGAPLPSSRALAETLGLARATVTIAYEQLAAEGYVQARQGACVRVASGVHGRRTPVQSEATRRESGSAVPPRPFAIGALDASLFPGLAWARTLARAWHDPRPMLGRADPLGLPALRVAIAQHLAQWRGLAADPGRIVITSGAAESIALVVRALLHAGDRVAVEDPGYLPLRSALARSGARVMPLRADHEGFDPAQLARRARVRAVLVTPSRQFPLGHAMPVARRLALLDWARRTGALVIEDDFDSEYRYRGAPLPALASLDAAARTIYLGSFSKVFSPAVRIGWMVLPDTAVAPIRTALTEIGTHASLVPQPALAEFITTGRLARHIRRTRRIFATRQAALLDAGERHFGGLLSLAAEPSGMHLLAGCAPALARRMDDLEAARRAAAAGITVAPLSAHASLRPRPQGLLLGFAGFTAEALDVGVRRLAQALS